MRTAATAKCIIMGLANPHKIGNGKLQEGFPDLRVSINNAVFACCAGVQKMWCRPGWRALCLAA